MRNPICPIHFQKTMNLFRPAWLTLAAGLALPAMAQTAPDAGQTLQQNQAPVLQTPRPSQGIDVHTPADSPTQPGGAAVPLKSLRFTGNTVFTQAQLQAVLGDVGGKTYDLAGLRSLAERISQHYRANGYPFARAFLPAQPMAQGVLRMDVVEGKYGKVTAMGDAKLAALAQDFLLQLKSDDVIASASLERATLILDDQPGITTSSIIRPGAQIGTGDLDVLVQRSARVTGDAGLDNFGNRYTGQNRVRANVNINSPFTLGDQIAVRTLYSELGLWSGNVDYSAPLGTSGLRGQVGYAHTYYALGKEFANLKASGTAKVTTVGVKYPLVRSQQTNASISASWQGKDLNDAQGTAGTSSAKSSQSLPLALIFDRRDNVGGGGISYGTLGYTAGDLRLDSTLRATDLTTAKSQGAFNKVTLDAARIQNVSPGVSLFGRVSAQWADKNLDSSEKLGLGGSNGVRAYPSGEGFGDQGWLAQLELRYSTGDYAPYAFYDIGDITTNAKPWATATNRRTLSGGGLGLRYQRAGWSMDALVAWRDQGGKPQSDTSASDPLTWLSLGYRF
jgi:hemolysin activation/secretion protein